MGWIGPTIATVGQVANSAVNAVSQSNLNLANREWSAQQATLNRQFQEQMLTQTEQYNTEMSDTAIQRRMQDAKNAGVNPMLAVTTGGASAPQMSPPAGSMAATPQTANPFENSLANVYNSALQAQQTQANIEKTKADAALTRAQTPGDYVALKDDGSPDYANPRTAGGVLGNLTAGQMYQSIQNAQSTWQVIQNTIKTGANEVKISDAQAEIAGMNATQLKQTLSALVAQAQAESKIAQAGVPAAQASATIMQGNRGVWITAIQMALQGIAQGASAIGNVAGGAAALQRAAPQLIAPRAPTSPPPQLSPGTF